MCNGYIYNHINTYETQSIRVKLHIYSLHKIKIYSSRFKSVVLVALSSQARFGSVDGGL